VNGCFRRAGSLLNLATKEKVSRENQELRLKRGVLEAAGARSAASDADLAAFFDSRVDKSGDVYLIAPTEEAAPTTAAS
jgi:hypothetical protein